MECDKKQGESVQLLENKIKAKKNVLKEVLRTIEGVADQENSRKKRNYIRDTLNCELKFPCEEHACCSVKSISAHRFQSNIIVRIGVTNWLTNGELSISTSIPRSDSVIRWTIFKAEDSLETLESIQNNSTALLCVSIPCFEFFNRAQISLVVRSKTVSSNRRLLSSSFYTVIGSNQLMECSPDLFLPVLIDYNSIGKEELDLKAIEFADEQRFLHILQCLLTVYFCLPISTSLDFSVFRQKFPFFSSIDFDVWRLFVGSDRFDGILIVSRKEEKNTKSLVIGASRMTVNKFMFTLSTKFSQN